jgi:dTDP-4-dehydrorhamnose 3,5-epimerase
VVCHSRNASSLSMMSLDQISEIDGVRISQVDYSSDDRGAFIKYHPEREFENRLDSVAVSINPNLGTIRGLHFQVEPFAEEKLVTCVQGSVFDVIIDLRPNSKTLGKCGTFELSAENRLQVYLPKGIAHGFQTLMPHSIIHYSLTSIYSPTSSFAIDPFGNFGFDWPLRDSLVSERDSGGVSLSFAIQKYAESLED